MVFSSLVFLCIFLPIVFLGHTILPGIRAKNAMLLLASLVFYAYGEPVYVVLMVASALCNYVCTLDRTVSRSEEMDRQCGGDPESRTSGDL